MHELSFRVLRDLCHFLVVKSCRIVKICLLYATVLTPEDSWIVQMIPLLGRCVDLVELGSVLSII